MTTISDEQLTQALGESPINNEAERNNTATAIIKSKLVSFIICLILTLLNLLVKKSFEFGYFSMLLATGGIIDLYELKMEPSTKKKIICIIELIIAALFFVLSVLEVFA